MVLGKLINGLETAVANDVTSMKIELELNEIVNLLDELKIYKVTQSEITWDDMTYPEIKQKLKEIYGDIPFLSAVTAMYWQLMNYKQLKEDYTDIDNKLRTANTENDELKRMLSLAVKDIGKLKNCEKYPFCGGCPKESEPLCKWKHHDEAMKLLGGTKNDKY